MGKSCAARSALVLSSGLGSSSIWGEMGIRVEAAAAFGFLLLVVEVLRRIQLPPLSAK